MRTKSQEIASSVVSHAEKKMLRRGDRIVVAVTDKNGKWVGVASNTTTSDVRAILQAAMPKPRSPMVIDTQGYEKI